MMRAILFREFTVATRRAPFAACLMVHLALLSAFLLIWPNGVPVMRGSVYEQALWIDAVVLACVLPWASIRLASTSDANTRVRLSVLSGARPSTVALGSLLGIASVMALITVTSLPLLLRAQHMAAEPWTRVVRDETALVAFACAVATVAAAAGACRDRVLRWLLTAASSLLLAAATSRAVHGSLGAALVFTAVAAIVPLLVVERARASGRYLVERHA